MIRLILLHRRADRRQRLAALVVNKKSMVFQF